jgi:hypothetical protein
MEENGSRKVLLIFASGVALGAVVSALSLAAVAAARPEPRAAEPATVVCKAEACPAAPECPACPDPTAGMPPVRDPPSPDNPPTQGSGSADPFDNGESVSERSCERARQRPMQVSDSKLAACARVNLLGSCHLNKGGPTTACAEYAFVDELCNTEGKCGSPLNGTGCVSASFYGSSNGFFNCSGDRETVAGCMMRKLAKAGYCKK